MAITRRTLLRLGVAAVGVGAAGIGGLAPRDGATTPRCTCAWARACHVAGYWCSETDARTRASWRGISRPDPRSAGPPGAPRPRSARRLDL